MPEVNPVTNHFTTLISVYSQSVYEHTDFCHS